ncbi:MAG: carboxylating nicotinate-nucleotide diphosphorylase [Planctomycetaceae bacterium]|jgi:nicotinate-nucleotide pyrophosphorylase (carboxylating)|nr:carboxylating nicotinate-nucleotide diphosphorylase [Planctomycetaceae bacterium]
MNRDFRQNDWDDLLVSDLDRLLSLAIYEDVSDVGDLTSLSLIPPNTRGVAFVVVREDSVVAGTGAIQTILNRVDVGLSWLPDSRWAIRDGVRVAKGTPLGRIEGPVQSMLTAERLVLNLVGRLSGIATLTREYVDAITGTKAKIYDTRKTTLGWRRLEKYAVRCGGGQNHRTGLFDAILIKDNHLAFGKENITFSPQNAIRKAKSYLQSLQQKDKSTTTQSQSQPQSQTPIIEIEVDTLEQLNDVLCESPDIVLLDNMPPQQLREAVTLRNKIAPNVELEASGGIRLTTVKDVAETGVERISVGALTHSATSIDIGLDWHV